MVLMTRAVVLSPPFRVFLLGMLQFQLQRSYQKAQSKY